MQIAFLDAFRIGVRGVGTTGVGSYL